MHFSHDDSTCLGMFLLLLFLSDANPCSACIALCFHLSFRSYIQRSEPAFVFSQPQSFARNPLVHITSFCYTYSISNDFPLQHLQSNHSKLLIPEGILVIKAGLGSRYVTREEVFPLVGTEHVYEIYLHREISRH